MDQGLGVGPGPAFEQPGSRPDGEHMWPWFRRGRPAGRGGSSGGRGLRSGRRVAGWWASPVVRNNEEPHGPAPSCSGPQHLLKPGQGAARTARRALPSTVIIWMADPGQYARRRAVFHPGPGQGPRRGLGRLLAPQHVPGGGASRAAPGPGGPADVRAVRPRGRGRNPEQPVGSGLGVVRGWGGHPQGGAFPRLAEGKRKKKSRPNQSGIPVPVFRGTRP